MSDTFRASSLRLHVPDPSRVAAFYVEKLGFEEDPEGVHLDAFRLELERGDLEEDEVAVGLEVTFRDEDARDVALDRAREAGLEVEEGEVVELPGGPRLHLRVGELPTVRLTRLTLHVEDPLVLQELAEVVLTREGNVVDARPPTEDGGTAEPALGGLCIVAPETSIRAHRDPFKVAVTFADPRDAVNPTPAGPRPGSLIDVG